MSVSINQQPESFYPAHNELVLSAKSTEEAQPFFRYFIRLYHDNTVIETFYYPPRPETGCKFDPAKILQGIVSFDSDNLSVANDGANVMLSTDGTFVNYKVDFIEQYGADQNTFASAQVSGLVAINGALQWQQWLNLAISDYLINNAGTRKKFLTNSPRNIRARADERVLLGAITNETSFAPSNPVFGVRFLTYNSAGANIGDYTFESNLLPASIQSNRFFDVLAGPADLVALATAAALAIDIDLIAYYELYIYDNVDGQENKSEVFTVTIDRDCSRYAPYRIHFLNRWGRFDSFTFKGDTLPTTESESKIATRTPGYADNQAWDYSSSRHSAYNFQSPYTNKWVLKADFITVAEKEWLEELMTSPAVFWQQGIVGDSTKLWAVNIERGNYEKQQHGLFSVTFVMSLSVQNNAQFR